MQEEGNMREILCDAIQNHALLRLVYGGGERIVEPHSYGITRAGNEVLRAYQVSGYSSSGQHIGWKLFDVMGITDVQETGEGFASGRSDFNPQDPAMQTIHCRIEG
jgi:hypothetical protein